MSGLFDQIVIVRINTNQGLKGKTPSYWVAEHQSQEICPVQILIKSFRIRSYLNPI